ncbi:uncharacterized protein rsh isoform X2 [Planococcus citri]|uniref:uncharacterized protein rsh isoform X2 n=1 Tax=Planococcus citri TaxID=170843 RepID=UPI0031F78112
MAFQAPRLRHYRTMTAVCFVCNLPILSYQVGLVWQGGNGWDDLMREQLEESTLRARLGGRRDSSAQITTISPPTETQETSPPPRRRRRSSLAQLTDIIKDWGGSATRKRKEQLSRRETLADLAKSLPWPRSDTNRKRRESSVDSGVKSISTKDGRQDSQTSRARTEIYRLLNNASRHQSTTIYASDVRRSSGEHPGRRDSTAAYSSRRGSGESGKSSRRESLTTSSPKHARRHHHHGPGGMSRVRRDSKPDFSFARDERRASLSAEMPSQGLLMAAPRIDCSTQALPPPTIITSSVTPPSTSPSVSPPCHTPMAPEPPPKESSPPSRPTSPQPSSSNAAATVTTVYAITTITTATTETSAPPITSPTHPLLTSRRDSTTQVSYPKRRESRSYASASPERRPSKELPTSKLARLQRQSTAIDESGFGLPGRRGSQPALSADEIGSARKTRRDSLSPDSARGRRDSRTHLSPERTGGERDTSPVGRQRRRSNMRRQSTSYVTTNNLDRRGSQQTRSPDSYSSSSSRDQSPSRPPPVTYNRAPAIRRQSTTEEILIARGFRRQSTTEEMIRCRNFRRQSSQSDDVCRYRGRRDSSAQITDGTLATMVVETGSTFFDSSTQTDPSPLYDNNHYHEECLRCNSCGLNLTGPNQKRARRFKNQILCDLHFADVALMECSDFMQQLRSFKPQSLGCAVARRKSSTTLIFPLPPQACSDEFCEDYPHNLIPTPGYWIECSRQKITNETLWDDTDTDADEQDEDDDAGEGPSRPRYRRDDSLLLEDDEYFEEEEEEPPPPRKKTTIEEQWEKNQGFELTSVEQETFEKYFYGTEHWNYFTNDEDLGPVILSLKQETINNRDQFRILVRAISYTVHGLIPASCVFADRYNREEVVRSLGKEVNLNPPLVLGQLPDTPEELLKLDQVFIKSELKVGVIYVKEGQYNEEEILDNNENSYLFNEFLSILGDTVSLKGFEKYRGGLDTVHDLTGEYSVYTNWRNIEIMFHVSTYLPYEKHDPQKLQRKRHIGNDIVCVVFLEADNTSFSPSCIKSHFLHTFIVVRTSPRVRRKTPRYEVSVVTRDEVGAYKPYLWEQSVFENGPMFREWILTKIVNGERASYSAPKFARMQERTRSQMLEDLVANLQNHAETGQIPKPYRRGSWRPIGHMRPSSPLLDSVRDRFEAYEQLASDFMKNFLNTEENMATNAMLFDVVFLVGQSKQKTKFLGVRAILGVRSRVFQEMLYGISAGFGSPQMPVAEILARAVPTIPSPQKPKSSNFLQVPDIESSRAKSVPSSPMVKRAFSRLGTLTAGWGRSIRGKQQLQLTIDDKKKWSSSHDCSNKETKEKEKAVAEATQLAVPRLSVCADAQKIDKTKLAQTEFSIIEFDAETFRILLNYLHTSTCPITCAIVPGLICAAEHYDLPELLQACFHHTKQHLRLEVICLMLNNLENYVWRYNSAVELVNLIFLYIEQHAPKVLLYPDFLTLSESMVNQIMNRDLDVPEIRKFEAILRWAKNKSKSKPDPKQEFKHIMDRLKKDINLMKIAPQDLIKIVLPSKTIENQAILDTLTKQANSGIYRLRESTFQDFHERVQRQRLTDWDSFDND